jgi:transcription elongation factor Elf1
MGDKLPAAVRKDETFSAIKDAALCWKTDSTCFFCNQHRRCLEFGTFGSSYALSKAVFYAVECCALCEQIFSSDAVELLDVVVEYLIHTNMLGNQWLVRVQDYLAIVKQERTWKDPPTGSDFPY